MVIVNVVGMRKRDAKNWSVRVSGERRVRVSERRAERGVDRMRRACRGVMRIGRIEGQLMSARELEVGERIGVVIVVVGAAEVIIESIVSVSFTSTD